METEIAYTIGLGLGTLLGLMLGYFIRGQIKNGN